jgi:hypothetical protein
MYKQKIKVSVYDAERYANGGNGAYSLYFESGDMTQEQIKAKVVEIREAQKLKNEQFKANGGKKQAQKQENDETIPRDLVKYEFKPIFDNGTGNTFCLFGSSKSGKTTLMMKLYNDYFPEFIPHKKLLTTLFAMNSQIDAYGGTLADANQTPLMMRCPFFNKATSQYIDWMRKLNVKNDNQFNFLVMLDDFIDVRYNSIVNNMVLTYRNSNINSIICLQYANLLSKSARGNINGVFLLHMNTDEVIKVVIDVYLKSFLKKHNVVGLEDSVEWYRQRTSEYGYIYINPLHGKLYMSKSSNWYPY